MISKIALKLSIIFISLILSGCVGLFVAGIAAGGAIAIIADSRDFDTSNKDNELRHQIYLRLKKDHEFDDSNITVASFHKVILLTGQVPNSLLKVKAEKITKTFKGIVRVYNEITVGKNIPLKSQSNDVWITTKVKSSIVAQPGLKSGSIKVITEDGVVYLMGKVSKNQALEAVATARKIAGVKKVVKAFQYLILKDEHQISQ